MRIGAQLYTVRDFTQTTNDFAKTIKKIADIGYDCVQISAIGSEITPNEIADICKENAVEPVITHTNPARILEETDAVINDHKIMGIKYVGIGMIPGHYGHTKDGFSRFISDFAPAARKIKEAGQMLMYHNHACEFHKHEGKSLFEYMADDFTDAGFTLDTFWVQAGGGDPAAWLRKLSGRVDVIHLKDFVIVEDDRRMAEVFEGNMNWDSIFDACKAANVKYAMVEQDDCYGQDPFECLRTSLENIKKRGLA